MPKLWLRRYLREDSRVGLDEDREPFRAARILAAHINPGLVWTVRNFGKNQLHHRRGD
jgi:hypothetical protein